MLVFNVQPVAMCYAVSCTDCRFVMIALDEIGDHIVVYSGHKRPLVEFVQLSATLT